MDLLTTDDELERLVARSSGRLVSIMRRLARARLQMDGRGYLEAFDDAVEFFVETLSESNLRGQRRMELHRQEAERRDPDRALMAAYVAHLDDLPSVEPKSAVERILSRIPVLAIGFRAVQKAYRAFRAFACARAMDKAVTERVQTVIAEAVRTGRKADALEVLDSIEGWTQAYADTVYQTNVASAYAEGIKQRAADPDVAAVIVGLRFVSAKLETSRANHMAAHGLVAPTDSPYWSMFTPPLGYNCKCALREVTIFEAREKGWVDENDRLRTLLPPTFDGAFPDPGFGPGGAFRPI